MADTRAEATGATPGQAGATPPAATDDQQQPTPPDAGATPPAGATPARPAASSDDPPLGEGGQSALVAERESNRKLREELQTLRAADKEREDAGKSELQRAIEAKTAAEQARTDDQTASRQVVLEALATAEAAQAGWQTPGDAIRYIDPEKVDWTPDGRPTNLREQLKKAVDQRAYLVATTSPPPGDWGAGQRGQGATYTPDVVRGMTQEQVADKIEEINADMSRQQNR